MTDEIPSSTTDSDDSDPAPESPDAATRLPVAFLITGFVLLLDWAFIGGTFRQLATVGYRQTEGQILSSAETTDSHGDPPATHGVAATYSYVVDGRSYRGTHWGADDDFGMSGSWAREVVALIPPGARVPVFYDARAPSRAVLRRGLNGGDLVTPLFMLPFNMLAFGVCCGYVLARRAERAGRRYVDPGLSPGTLALVVLGASPLPICGVVVLGFGSNPPLSTMLVTWALPFFFAGVAFSLAKAKRRRASELSSP